MKFLLDEKYLVSMAAIGEIVEVEAFGGYTDRKYKIIGEPSGMSVVADSAVVEGEAAKQAENESATEQLKTVQEELAKLRLDVLRKEAVERIVAEKRGLSREVVEAWAKTQTFSWTIPTATSDDVRKWKRYIDQKESVNQ